MSDATSLVSWDSVSPMHYERYPSLGIFTRARSHVCHIANLELLARPKVRLIPLIYSSLEKGKYPVWLLASMLNCSVRLSGNQHPWANRHSYHTCHGRF